MPPRKARPSPPERRKPPTPTRRDRHTETTAQDLMGPNPIERYGVEVVFDHAEDLIPKHGSGTKIKGQIRLFVFDRFIDGYQFRDIARLVQKHFGIKVTHTSVQDACTRHIDTIKLVAEKKIGLYLNKGLANKATRIQALVHHYNTLQEMIEQHKLSKRGSKKKVWAVLPALPQLLAEVRKTLKDIREEVEPVRINVDRNETITIRDETARKAVEELRDHAKDLPDEVREAVGTALAGTKSRLSQEIWGESGSDPLSEQPGDRASDEGTSTVEYVPPSEDDTPDP